jgi:cytochrome bd-type quinol oxidase subunit 1
MTWQIYNPRHKGFMKRSLIVIDIIIIIIIIIIIFSGSAAQRGLWPTGHTKLLDHTQRRATVGRTPLDE